MVSRDYQGELINQLNEKGVSKVCPFCGNEKFAITNIMSSDVPLEGNGTFVFTPKKVVPSIQVICNNCGYIANFALIPKK